MSGSVILARRSSNLRFSCVSRGILVAAALTAALVALLAAAAGAAARPTNTGPATLPGELWGIEVSRGNTDLLAAGGAKRLARAGMTGIVIGRLGGAAERRARKLARRSGLTVFGQLPTAAPATVTGDRCRLLERGHPGTRCVVGARTRTDALALAQGGVADVVAVRVKSPGQLRSLAAADERVVAIATLEAPVLTAPWRAAIRAAHRSPGLDLVVAPRGKGRVRALADFLWLLRPVRPSDRRAPSAPAGLSADGGSPGGVALMWQAPSAADGVVRHTVYRDGERVGSVTVPAAQVDGLACGHGYVLEVDAVDAAGNHSGKAPVIASTAACGTAPSEGVKTLGITAPLPAPLDLTPPSAPTGLAATNRVGSSLTLTWLPSTDNVAVTGYRVLVDGNSAGTVPAPVAELRDLACGMTHRLAVQALDAAGNASAPTEILVTIGACPDTQAPAAPSGLAASNRTTTSLTFSWQASSDNVGVTGYRSFRDGASSATTTATSRSFTGLACGTTYTVAVEAYDAAGNTSPRSQLQAATLACPDTQAPSAPSGLAITGRTTTSLTLTWQASTDNAGVTGYRSFRDGASSATGTTRTRTFTGLTCATTYTLAVEAYDAAGNTSPRSQLQAATAACPDTQAPTAPSGLAVTARAATSLTLSWQASSDNVGVTGYSTFRDGADAGDTTATTKTFSGLACGTTYTLSVEAYDAAGNTSPQSSLQGVTSDCPLLDTQAPTAPSGLAVSNRTTTSLTLAWDASTDDTAVTGYRSFRDSADSATTTTTSRTFSGLTCGTSYALAVEAYDAAANTSPRSTLQASTADCPPLDSQAPSAPSGLTITGRTASSLTLSWQASSDNLAVAGYRLFRESSPAGTTPATSHTFDTLACDTAYRLSVEAYDAAGNTSPRTELQASTSACAPTTTASVFLSPSGSDANACTQAAPCKTLARGYRVADPGDQVELAAGVYPGQQEIPVDSSKTAAADVIFRPAAGAAVRIEALDVFGNHVEVRGITIDIDFYVKCQANDVTLRDSKARLFFIRSADNVSIVDTEFGPSDTISQIGIIGGDAPCEPAPTNILMDGVYMHDFTNDNDAVHMECLTVQSFVGMVIRRSRFHHCEDFNILFKARAPTIHSRDLLIENTWFDLPWPDGSSVIQFSEPGGGASFTDVTIRNNSFGGTLTLKPEPIYVNTSVVGNVGTRWGGTCSDVTSSHNVWSGTPGCTSTDKQAPTGFVSQGGFDFHLQPGAAAIGNGHPTNHPATDIDGDARPQGGAPDSGADEFR
jgi:chitodextrinase